MTQRRRDTQTGRARVRGRLGFVVSCIVVSEVWLGAVASAESPAKDADALFEGEFEVDHEKPESKVPSEAQRNASPVAFGNWLMSVTEAGERASQTGDHRKAISYFRALALAVPESAAAFRRLCDSYEALNQRAQAEAFCAAALRREGVRVSDYLNYAHLVLKQSAPLTARQTGDLDAVVNQLRSQHADLRVVAELECLVSLKLQSPKRLEACVRSLKQQAPNDPLTIGYEWRWAIARLDRSAAEAAVARAKQHNLPAETVRSMEAATKQLMHPWQKLLRQNLRSVLVVVAVLLFSGGVWLAMRRRRVQRFAASGPLQDSNASVR